MELEPEVLTIKRDETAQDLFRRMDCRPFVLGIPPIDRAAAARGGSSGLCAGDVVEVFGESGSGKTEVLMGAVARTVLPEADGGTGRLVVYFDHDSRLNLARLGQIVTQRAIAHRREQRQESQVASGEVVLPVDEVVRQSLGRIWRIRCSTTFEFVAALERLYHELEGREAMVVVDNIGAFYFRDRVTESMVGNGTTLQLYALKSLARLVADRAVLLVASKAALYGGPRDSGQGEKRSGEYMDKLWTSTVKFRATASREQGHWGAPRFSVRLRARAVRGAHHGPGAGAEAGAGENTEGGDENFVFEIRDEGVVSC